MPWINDTKFFFYNKKMLADAGHQRRRPRRGTSVVTDAKAIKAKGIVQYPLAWSWQQAEAASSATGRSWRPSSAARTSLTPRATRSFNQGGGLGALQFMKQTIDDGLTNPASLGFVEDDGSQHLGSAGNAAFALNWTFVLRRRQRP